MQRCFVIVAAVAFPITSLAQTPLSETQRRANDAFLAQDWVKAAEAYQALLTENPRAAQPHFRFAVSLIGLKRHSESRSHLYVAESLGSPAAQVAFRLAQVHAAAGVHDSAFAELRRATNAGLGTPPVSTDSDPALAGLKTDARFAQFITDMDRNARPCMHNARHNEFDFWLGTWDVRPNAQPNAPPARNVISKIHDGCVVLESWSAPGSTGQSFNMYDRTRGKWFQKWVDNGGGLHEYAGELRDGNMVFEGDMPAPRPSNSRVRVRLTFFPRPDGSVRQFSERTTDNGVTWQVNYDLIYTRSGVGS
ncbi:MAG: tetratricopeptide repeat protein [Gemmatimonadaceae bacterium]